MNLPLLETLINIADDNKNCEIVPIDGPTQHDFIKEINIDCGINTELEIVMENAQFLDQNLLAAKTKLKTNSKKKTSNTRVTLQTPTPGSPKGQLTVR